jgi:hypothetical protein
MSLGLGIGLGNRFTPSIASSMSFTSKAKIQRLAPSSPRMARHRRLGRRR